jgi:hypothetical protein
MLPKIANVLRVVHTRENIPNFVTPNKRATIKIPI